MAKKPKKFADGGDVYEGTDLARAMGIKGVPEPGLEAVYPEQSIGGVGSIKGVGGSAIKAAEEAMVRKAQEKAFNRANRFATGKIRQYSPEEKAAEAARLKANVEKAKRSKTETGRPTSVGERLETEPREPLSGKLGGKGGLKFPEEGPDYKKGGRVKVSSASKRADGIAIRGKTRA
jgi:hypothetical protein